jgi:hypothetical protein
MFNDRSKSSIPTNKRRKIIFDDDEEAEKENTTQLINVMINPNKLARNSKISNSSSDKTRPSSATSSTRHTSKKEPEVVKAIPKPIRGAVKDKQPKKKDIERTDFKQRRKFPNLKTQSKHKPNKAIQLSARKKLYVASIKFIDIDDTVSFPLFKDVDVLSSRKFDHHLIPQELDNDIETDEEMMDDAVSHSMKNLEEGIEEWKLFL